VTVSVIGGFGSSDVRVVTTSSGDTTFSGGDSWAVVKDTGTATRPAVTFVCANPLAPVKVHEAELQWRSFTWSYRLNVAAGETAALLHFAAQSDTEAAAIDRAGMLMGLRNQATDGLRETDWQRIVNFRRPDGWRFVRGDCDANGRVAIGDPITILLYLFAREAEPPCVRALDADDNGRVNLGDAVGLLSYLFSRGFGPRRPFPECGPDTTDDPLSCASFPPCTVAR
jgi:hypothetical protein